MDALLPFILGSLKALVLLIVASGVALVLQRRSARLRAVVWSLALAGCLAIPIVAPLLPAWSVPMPAALARFTPSENLDQRPLSTNMSGVVSHHQLSTVNISNIEPTSSMEPKTSWPWQSWILAIWAVGAAILLTRLGLGLSRVSAAVRLAHPVTDPRWLRHFDCALRAPLSAGELIR